jgi:hypothetical protein
MAGVSTVTGSHSCDGRCSLRAYTYHIMRHDLCGMQMRVACPQRSATSNVVVCRDSERQALELATLRQLHKIPQRESDCSEQT